MAMTNSNEKLYKSDRKNINSFHQANMLPISSAMADLEVRLGTSPYLEYSGYSAAPTKVQSPLSTCQEVDQADSLRRLAHTRS